LNLYQTHSLAYFVYTNQILQANFKALQLEFIYGNFCFVGQGQDANLLMDPQCDFFLGSRLWSLGGLSGHLSDKTGV
jgi:hypothetical protein